MKLARFTFLMSYWSDSVAVDAAASEILICKLSAHVARIACYHLIEDGTLRSAFALVQANKEPVATGAVELLLLLLLLLVDKVDNVPSLHTQVVLEVGLVVADHLEQSGKEVLLLLLRLAAVVVGTGVGVEHLLSRGSVSLS